MGSILLPCSECGAELARPEAEDVVKTIEADPCPHFAGAVLRKVSARRCPDCGFVSEL